MQLTPRDLYRLRRTKLMAQRAALRAQLAQQQVQELSLELERRYGLLAQQAVLDLETGVVTLSPTAAGQGRKEEAIRGSTHHADQSPS